MRIGILIGVCVVLGVSAGYGLTLSEFMKVDERFAGRLRDSSQRDRYEEVEKIAKVVLVESDEYNFGVLQRHQRRNHTFRIKNGGEAMLQLQFYNRSCGQCIATSFKGASIATDEVVEIDVEFRTAKPDEDFVHYVEFNTNDLELPVLRLYVRGKVTERVRLSHPALDLDKVSASAAKQESFRIYGYYDERLEVLSHSFSNPETADRFELEFSQVDVDQLDLDPPPRAAMEVQVRVKEGMPVGQINQTITLTVDAGEEVVASMPIEGEVASDISLRGGPAFNDFRNLLTLGRVASSEGAEETVVLFVRGPHRDKVEFSVESIDPANVLDVEVGEATSVANNLVRRVPLKISIAPGAPFMSRLGNDQGKIAKIAIATTHPESKQLMIYVSFLVE